jgi:DNA-binding XRE family transcriptional regulator
MPGLPEDASPRPADSGLRAVPGAAPPAATGRAGPRGAGAAGRGADEASEVNSQAIVTTYLQRDNMSPQRIGGVLKRLREQKGLSQYALAKKSGVAQGYISEMEAGAKKNPGIETLRKIAKALGIPVTELLE